LARGTKEFFPTNGVWGKGSLIKEEGKKVGRKVTKIPLEKIPQRGFSNSIVLTFFQHRRLGP